MKKQKKFLIGILIFLSIILSSYTVFAVDIKNYIEELEFSDEYKKYMELEKDEKANVLMPRMYDIPKTTVQTQNPFRLFRMLGITANDDFSLRTFIPENMVIKDQNSTNSCWTFSSLAALESHLALKHKRNYTTPAIVYDFSERHMEYSMSQSFYDGPNALGFNRQVGSGGHFQIYIPYLTNGTGAVAESAMPFQTNENKTYLSEIQGHEVISQVNDIVEFPSYTPAYDLTLIKQQMKEHIRNYGAIDAAIYGAGIYDTRFYNNATGALYCNDSDLQPNHAVAIVGWMDNYPVSNFVSTNKPQNPGAWIIKNSWGTSQVVNGETVKIGDEGFMYVSYEDINIYTQLTGIEDAQDELSYENIYQYSEFDGYMITSLSGTSKIYLATVFNKKTAGLEYLTQVALRAPETYTCKVYVNPNGTDKIVDETTKVALKMGESETIQPGYHTIEFLEPVQITGNSFVVIVEVQGVQANKISTLAEFNSKDYAAINSTYKDNYYNPLYDNVKVESGKCFWTIEEGIATGEWNDTSTMATVSSGNWPNFDTTIKAFTTSRIFNGIAVTTPPSITTYIEGDDFDPAGMVVEALFTNGDSEVITDYTISEDKDLKAGQTAVTITYQGKTTTQRIEVKENVVESLTIATPPSTTSYIEGDNFDPTGMVVQATRINGDTEVATDYTILYGDDLEVNQGTVTILYEGVTVTQDIEVIENVVETLTITTPAPITSYIEGDDFDPTGMVVQATRINGDTEVITNYTIPNGESLSLGQTSVIITYEGKTTTQSITVTQKIEVLENVVNSISIVNPPKKTSYIEGQDFDPTAMLVQAKRLNGDTEVITGYKINNGTELTVGQASVTITYKELSTTQAIKVVAKQATAISIKSKPTKTEYSQNKEKLDLTGGIIEVSYNDGDKKDFAMKFDKIVASGFDNTNVGKQVITLTFENLTAQFEIEIKEEPKPENSNFDNIITNVKKIRAYYFTDDNEKEYVIIDVAIDNFIKSKVNENLEYYYCLSATANSQARNMPDWIKIENIQETAQGMTFEINSLDIPNYEELVEAETIYLSVKEVATRNEMTKEAVISSVSLDVENITVEEYIDGEKKADVNSDDIIPEIPTDSNDKGDGADDTLASGVIPHAGTSALMIVIIFAISIFGRATYLRYRNIQIK